MDKINKPHNETNDDPKMSTIVDKNPKNPWDGFEIIHTYTRKQALEDGFQIDVSETAREAGIRFPVYLTRSVWDQYVQVPEGVDGQDERGRLWDIVYILRCSIQRSNGEELLFKLHIRNDNRETTPPLITLKAVCGPVDIDDPAPVITVMLPNED